MKRLVVCTDGSHYSHVSCEYAAHLSERSGARVDLLYLTDIRRFEVPLIADLSGSLGIQPYQDVMKQLQELEKRKARIIEESSRKIFAKEGQELAVSFYHQTGLLVDCLKDFEAEIDLVILGKRGENAEFVKEHIGSSVERVLRASQKPCLVTSRAFREIKKITLAYDGSESSQKALQFLIHSEAFKGLELHIVTVVEQDKGLASERLDEVEATASDAGYHAIGQKLYGNVEETMSHYVESHDIDLLVMGAYGHSRIRYLLIGSTTTAMIRSCHIPVLCLR